MNDAQAGVATTVLGEGGLDFGFATDDVKLGDFGDGLEGEFNAIKHDPASVVAAHDIHDDSHKRKERGGCSYRALNRSNQAFASTLIT